MIFAMDPGSEKTGIALVEDDGTLHRKAVVPTADLQKSVGEYLDEGAVSAFVMGNGTHHKEIRARMEAFLRERGSSLPVSLVNEKYTTEMGEQRYKKDHPPKGLARFLPSGMRTVSEPVDDYVAWIIGEIYLGTVKAEAVGHRKDLK